MSLFCILVRKSFPLSTSASVFPSLLRLLRGAYVRARALLQSSDVLKKQL